MKTFVFVLLVLCLTSSIVSGEEYKERHKRASGSQGAVYTRWGQVGCPINSHLIYSGVAAGSHYSQSGGGANYLCLPNNPEWNTTRQGVQSCGAFIYGAEYKVCSQGNVYPTSVHNQNVPCSVCQATGRLSYAMFPASLICPSGWMHEYQGFLVSSHHSQYRTEWVCMDQSPEAIAGGGPDQRGSLFYTTEARCGVLPCPPYSEGGELSCVVCTQ